MSNLKNSSKDLTKTPQTLKVVALLKSTHLQYRVYELTIVDGKVVSKRALDRGAGDLVEIQVARADDALWDHRHQDESLISSFKDS